MKIENNIGWCDITGNPGIGCRGCELGDDCYALNDTPARVLRAGAWPGHIGEKIETFGKGRTFVPTKKGLSDLRRLNKLCICDDCHETYPVEGLSSGFKFCADCNEWCGSAGGLRHIRFFADSNSDFMDWPVEILAQALDEIRQSPNVDVILLTKWPELFYDRMDMTINHVCQHYSKTDSDLVDWIKEWIDADLSRPNPWVPRNIWILTSVLGNALDEKRIEAVLKIPAAVRGLSCEPLWSKPHLHSIDAEKIQWIIVGCDSSKHRKGWEDYEANARGIIQSGHAAGIAVYHKQMPVNGKVSLKLAEFPAEDLRVRKFPKIPVDSRAGI